MSDVGESLSFDPTSHFELQPTDGNGAFTFVAHVLSTT